MVIAFEYWKDDIILECEVRFTDENLAAVLGMKHSRNIQFVG